MKVHCQRSLLLLMLVCCTALITSGCSRTEQSSVQTETAENKNGWKPPDETSIPAGPVGDSISQGEQIFLNTPRFAPAYVGNQLSCTNCHINTGAAAYSAPMVGLPGLFPMYNQRAGRVITLEDRIQECFLRSENGHPLPYSSPEMIAIVSYIQWLSQGIPAGHAFPGRGLVKLPALHGDASRGAELYAKQCAGCHGANGAGDPPVLPPLWGPGSYNDGAGMNRIDKMAAFVQHNMPNNHPGTLTPQQAFDVSAYVSSKPRPKLNPAYKSY
jgi:thiosulfate dehydrogenase